MRVKIDSETKKYRTIWMSDNGILQMIDQNKLPYNFEIYSSCSYKDTAMAIKNMTIRGAGAIGAAGAYAMSQAAVGSVEKYHLEEVARILKDTRPTAIALSHAVNRVLKKAENSNVALSEANKIADENVEQCKLIGYEGLKLIKRHGGRIATHCNAGWLAFVDYGTALAPVYTAYEMGMDVFVYVDETRPRSQGRLTAWELQQENIPFIFVPDTDSTHFQNKEVDMIIVGADRIARNGDVANKIGTYQRALVAKDNNIPFYVAAPLDAFDLNCNSGKDIPIEERSQEEVLYSNGLSDEGEISRVLISPKGCKAKNPAFDITRASLITGIITPKRIINSTEEEILKLFKQN